MLERKQELQGGGKRAAIRSWKYMYTAIFGQVMAFFKDKEGNILLEFPMANIPSIFRTGTSSTIS
jgi:hypothetical protein